MSDNVKLFVGNLPLDATHDELNKLFSPHGEVNTCSLLRQYAFITLKGEGAADRYGDTDSLCIPSHYISDITRWFICTQVPDHHAHYIMKRCVSIGCSLCWCFLWQGHPAP